MKDYEPLSMPPKTQEIEGSEEAVQVLHKKLQSLFEKIDKKEQEAEEVEKVYIYIIFFNCKVAVIIS